MRDNNALTNLNKVFNHSLTELSRLKLLSHSMDKKSLFLDCIVSVCIPDHASNFFTLNKLVIIIIIIFIIVINIIILLLLLLLLLSLF